MIFIAALIISPNLSLFLFITLACYMSIIIYNDVILANLLLLKIERHLQNICYTSKSFALKQIYKTI